MGDEDITALLTNITWHLDTPSSPELATGPNLTIDEDILTLTNDAIWGDASVRQITFWATASYVDPSTLLTIKISNPFTISLLNGDASYYATITGATVVSYAQGTPGSCLITAHFFGPTGEEETDISYQWSVLRQGVPFTLSTSTEFGDEDDLANYTFFDPTGTLIAPPLGYSNAKSIQISGAAITEAALYSVSIRKLLPDSTYRVLDSTVTIQDAVDRFSLALNPSSQFLTHATPEVTLQAVLREGSTVLDTSSGYTFAWANLKNDSTYALGGRSIFTDPAFPAMEVQSIDAFNHRIIFPSALPFSVLPASYAKINIPHTNSIMIFALKSIESNVLTYKTFAELSDAEKTWLSTINNLPTSTDPLSPSLWAGSLITFGDPLKTCTDGKITLRREDVDTLSTIFCSVFQGAKVISNAQFTLEDITDAVPQKLVDTGEWSVGASVSSLHTFSAVGTIGNSSIDNVIDYLGRGTAAWKIACSGVASGFSTTVSDINVGVTYRAYSFFKYETASAPASSTLAFSLEKPGVSFSKHDADHDALVTQSSPIVHQLTLAEYVPETWYCLVSYLYRRDNEEVLQASAVYNVATGQRVTELFDYQWGGFLNSLTFKITATGVIDDTVYLNGPQFEACTGEEAALETLFSSRLSDYNFKQLGQDGILTVPEKKQLLNTARTIYNATTSTVVVPTDLGGIAGLPSGEYHDNLAAIGALIGCTSVSYAAGRGTAVDNYINSVKAIQDFLYGTSGVLLDKDTPSTVNGSAWAALINTYIRDCNSLDSYIKTLTPDGTWLGVATNLEELTHTNVVGLL